MSKAFLSLFPIASVRQCARVAVSFWVAATFLLLVGCASTPVPPDQALQAAESAIARADQDRVADYASPELRTAREKLTAARAAVQQEDMLRAQHLAEQSQADAELALVKADTMKAQKVNEEMQKSIDAMRQEMDRKL